MFQRAQSNTERLIAQQQNIMSIFTKLLRHLEENNKAVDEEEIVIANKLQVLKDEQNRLKGIRGENLHVIDKLFEIMGRPRE